MLKERARIYYQEKDDNCAQAIIRAANDEYALGINEAGPESLRRIWRRHAVREHLRCRMRRNRS